MNRHLHRGRGLLLGASTIALAFASTAAWAQPAGPSRQVDIPAQALAAQLQELGRETNTDILFSPDAVAHLRGPALHGAMSARQAVERLIANTPLQVTLGADGALIVRASTGVQATPAAALYRAPPSDPQPQAAAAPPAPSQAVDTAPPNTTVDEVVVVGSVNPQGQRKLATGYAITTVNEQAIHDVAPSSAADLLKVVPGIFVETTSGVSGPNIEVRGFPTAGDSPFVTMQLDSLPIFPTPSLSFLDNSTQFRLDDTIKRVEATIGGPAVLLGNGQPGATINFVQKNGKDDPGGSLRFTTGTGDLYRVDGYYGAKLADGWYGSIGGFYRTDDGVRDTQFPADKGYQFVGTLTHDIEDGKMQLYARVTHDQNAFFSPIPLNSSGTGSNVSISPFPGFNPLTATFLGNATRFVTFDTTPGLNGAAPGSKTVDLSKGRGVDNHIIGFDFDKSFDGWDFSNKLSYIDEDAPTIAQFTGDTPTTLGAFVQSEVAAANANPAALAAAGRPATTGSATLVGTGQAANLNQQVIQIGVWDVDKHLNAFQDEARLTHEIFSGNTLTLGMYFADYHSHDTWFLGNNQLMTVQNNAEPVAVTLDNGVQATSPDGIVSPVSFALNNSYDGKNVAGIISDSWRVTSKLRVDAGFRYEWETVDATIGNIATENLSSNPLAIYDNGASVLTGTSSPLSYGGSASAISIDANYEFTRRLNGFVGYNHGYALPTFDDLRQGVRQTTYVDQVQGGLKTYGRFYAADVTAFYSKFQGQPTSQILTNGTTVTFITDSQTEGVEFDGDVRPFQPTDIDLLKPLDLAISGDYEHGTYTSGGAGIQGNQVARQPDIQFRFTPSYTAATPVGPLKLYGVLTYVAQRWADLQSTQSLPEYATLDVGASLDLPHGIQLQFTGTNVTNTLAITEGNVRVLGSGVAAGGVFLGRPLFGADYQFSAVIRF